MANRSYLYAINEAPVEGNDETRKILGLSEYNYNIPFLFLWLVSFKPKATPSSIFDKKENLAIIGDAKAAREAMEDVFQSLPQDHPQKENVEKTLNFFNRAWVREYPYILLEPGEIFDLSEQKMSLQLAELLHEVKQANAVNFLKAIEEDNPPCDYWTHTLYYEPKGTVKPEFNPDSSYHYDTPKALLEKMHGLMENPHISKLTLTCDDKESLEATFTALADIPHVTELVFKDLTNDNLPDNFDQLKHIKEVNFMRQEITRLPASFSAMPKIESVRLGKTKITEVPEALRPLKTLKCISLSHIEISSLPDWIGEFPLLVDLFLGYTKLKSLPSSIGNLSRLEFLTLEYAELTELPGSMAKLTELIILDVSANDFSKFPKVIFKFSKLENLSAYSLKLEKFPKGLTRLKNLEKLNMRDNKLRKIPKKFGKMPNLKHVDFAMNPLKDIPESLRKYPMERLTLTDTYVEEGPIGFAATRTSFGWKGSSSGYIIR